MATVDEAFRGAGTRPGLQIWCIDNFRLTPVPKSSHGKFYSGSSYIVLNTTACKSGAPQHDIHYWLGQDSKEADAALASEKALELDIALGSCSVQYLEVQGRETVKFLSYFKPCIIPINGEFSSEGPGLDSNTNETRLFKCKGEHAAYVTEVPLSRTSLNHNDVFILDTESKIFLFCGSNSSIQERAKALEVVQYIMENKHAGRCNVANIEDGKFVGDHDAGEFWSLFGGYAPLPRDPPCTNLALNFSCRDLFWINKGKVIQLEATQLDKEMLDANRCYMLDCGSEIFVWMGRNTLVTERKMSISATEEFVRAQSRPTSTHITILTEGSETAIFKSHFVNWPVTVAQSLYEEGRGKVAAIFKYQGYDVKELPEDGSYQPFIDCNGTLKVWLVDGSDISLIPASEQRKLYSSNCYIVQYTYPYGGRDDHLFYAWFGHSCTEEDRISATSHVTAMVDQMKSRAVMAQLFECKEPIQFFSIFQTLIIFRGSTSPTSGEGCANGTCSKEKTALFRVQGSGPSNMQAIQVDLVCSSLNSAYCYILQDESYLYAWTGNLSSEHDQDLLYQMLHLIDPLKQHVSIREGSEPDSFWNAIGERMDYPRQKEIANYNNDPHLFSCVLKEGDFKGKEIFNFSQDDLNTENVLVLDYYYEIYIWVGRHAGVASTKEALTIGKKFLEADFLLEGLSPETAIYVVTEGYEPPFFTCFFDWDFSKSLIHGNSFERKLALLKGVTPHMTIPRSFSHSGQISSEYNPAHGRKIETSYSCALSTPGTPKYHAINSTAPSPVTRQLIAVSPVHAGNTTNDLSNKDSFSESCPEKDSGCIMGKVEAATMTHDSGNGVQDGLKIFPYDLLKVPSEITVPVIDVTKREAYLSRNEFQEKFGMSKEVFYQLPLWKQNRMKLDLHLF